MTLPTGQAIDLPGEDLTDGLELGDLPAEKVDELAGHRLICAEVRHFPWVPKLKERP